MAEHADGSIIVDTEIDSSGFKAGSAELKSAIRSLSNKISGLGPTFQKAMSGNTKAMGTFEAKATALKSKISDLEAKMAKLGHARLPTADYKFFSLELEKAQRQLAQLEAREAKMGAMGIKDKSAAYKSLQYDITLTKEKIMDLEATMAGMRQNGTAFQMGTATAEYQQMATSLAAAKQQMAEMDAAASSATAKASTLPSVGSRIAAAFAKAGSVIKSSVVTGLRMAAKAAGTLLSNTLSAVTGMNRLGKSAQRAGSKAGRGFLGMMKSMLFFTAFSAVLKSIKQGIDALALSSGSFNETMSQLKTSMAQLRNSFITAFAPILSVVVPILSILISKLAQAITYIGQFFAALTGAKTFTKAITKQQDYAASLKDTAGAAKEAKRQLAGFDELNVLSDTSSSGGGGSTEDPGVTFEEVPIDSGIAGFVAKIKEAFANGEYAEIGRIIGEKINEVFQSVNDYISWDRVGEPIKKYIHIFCEIFNSLVDTIDWALIGDTFAQGINTIVNTLYYLLTGIDWESLGRAFGDGLNGLVYGVDWKRLGETIGAYFMARLNVIYGAITTFDWKGAGNALGTAIMSLWSSIDWAKAGSTLSTAVKGVLNSITEAIKAVNWQQVGNDVASFIAGIDWSGTVSALSGGIGAALGGLTATVIGFLQPAWESVVDWWYDSAYEDGEFTITGLLEGIGKGLVGIGTWILDNIIVPFCAGFDAASGGLLTALWETLSGIWQSLVDWWYDVAYEDGKFTMDGLMLGILEVFCNIGQWLSDNIFTPFVNGFKELFGINSPSTVMQELGGFLIEGLHIGITSAWSSITSFLAKALPEVTSAVSTGWANVKKWTSEAWNKASSTVSNSWNTVKTATTNAAKTVKDKVSDAWSDVKKTVSDKLGSAKEDAAKAWDTIKQKADDTGAKIASAVGLDWTEIKQTVTNQLNAVKSFTASAWTAIKSNAQTVNKSIKALLTSDWSTIKAEITRCLNNIKSTASSAWNNIKSTVSSASSNIQSRISSCWSNAASRIRSSLSSISSSMSSTFNSLVSKAYTWGSHICDNIYNGIRNGINKVVSAAKSLASSIRSYIGFSEPEKGPLSDFHTYMPDMIDLMVKGINDNKSRAVGAISGVAEAISNEVQNGDYGTVGISTEAQVSSSLAGFGDTIANSFAELMNRLQAIANGVSFASPEVVNGVMPYSVSAAQNSSRGGSGGSESNDDISSVVIQSVNNATVAIVKAIEQYSQTNVNIDSESLADSIINEINRRTRMSGKSPLLT